jgi:sugar lactone lactonase YvrE
MMLLVSASLCQAQDVQYFYSEAKKALAEKNYGHYYDMIQKAYQLHPYNQNVLWHMGMAAAVNGRPDESITFLKRAINISTAYDLDDPNLLSLKDQPEYLQLVKSKEMLNLPVIHSDTAFVLQDRQLHLESVAFDPVDGALYCGSIHKRKIVKINSRGVVSDFTRSEQYGMGGVFGLKVDKKNRVLWACSAAIGEMQHYDSTVAASLLKFDLKTGQLINVYQPEDTLKGHIFGDLALDAKGVPYVSDSRNNVIYVFDAKLGKLVPYFSSPEFWNIQGLAFSDNDKQLYIADYIKGIFMLDIQTRKLSVVNASYDLSLKGSDGIIFFGNSLITIQNGVQPNRVVRNYFDPTGHSFTRYQFIDNAHPAFGEPTIGTLSGSTLYYVANSQWGGYTDGVIKNESELQPVVVLKQVLKKSE